MRKRGHRRLLADLAQNRVATNAGAGHATSAPLAAPVASQPEASPESSGVPDMLDLDAGIPPGGGGPSGPLW
jgi:hypothetical protein